MKEDHIALENRCIRSFIIKSIQLIVQSRSGNVFNTNCISDVGARNNMMIYLEDDPEIGASIKRALQPESSGCSLEFCNRFCLDILARRSVEEEHLILMEVWQFTWQQNNNSPPASQHTTQPPDLSSSPSKASSSSSSSPHSPSDTDHLTNGEKLRLFECLGTLLKSIMVLSRLLPAYQYSRCLTPINLPLFYVIRRGDPGVDRLGVDLQTHQLSVPISSRGTLKMTVHYRTKTTLSSPKEMVYVVPPNINPAENLKFDPNILKTKEPIDSKRRLEKAPGRFGDPTDLSDATCKHLLEPPREEEEDENVEECDDKRSKGSTPLSDNGHLSPTQLKKLTNQSGRCNSVPPRGNTPEQRPRPGYDADHAHESGSSPPADGVTMDSNVELTNFFAELRDTVSLDLFRRQSSSPAWSHSLSEDLERHETTLKEFDDFLTEFEVPYCDNDETAIAS